MADVVLDTWAHTTGAATRTIVLPDGCRDLILRIGPEGRGAWFVTDLDDHTDVVATKAGEHFLGFRFFPGVTIDTAPLLQTLCEDDSPQQVRSLIRQFVHRDARIAEALAHVAEAGSVAAAARSSGVPERSLERLLMRHTGKTPGFWKALARVRRAAAALSSTMPLAEIAALCRFADQAHMTRAFGKWFGVSPARFRARPDLLSMVKHPGYG